MSHRPRPPPPPPPAAKRARTSSSSASSSSGAASASSSSASTSTSSARVVTVSLDPEEQGDYQECTKLVGGEVKVDGVKAGRWSAVIIDRPSSFGFHDVW